MWEALKSVAFVLFSVMVALILQAHAEMDEVGSVDRSDDLTQESIAEHIQAQMPNN